MNQENTLKHIKEDIACLCKYVTKHNGYLDSINGLYDLELSYRETEIALRYGIPIGMCSLKKTALDKYIFTIVSTMDDIERLSLNREFARAPFISPLSPNPNKMLGYIFRISNIEQDIKFKESGKSISETESKDDSKLLSMLSDRMEQSLKNNINHLQSEISLPEQSFTKLRELANGIQSYITVHDSFKTHHIFPFEAKYLLRCDDPLTMLVKHVEKADRYDRMEDIVRDVVATIISSDKSKVKVAVKTTGEKSVIAKLKRNKKQTQSHQPDKKKSSNFQPEH